MENRLSAAVSKSFGRGPELELRLEADFGAAPIHVLFGESGSGKSTLLRMLCGLTRPDRGTIRFRDETWFDAASADLPPQRRRVGFVPQVPALFPHLTVLQNVAYSGADPARWIECLELGELRHRFPHQLSGGQKQRVALARALAAAPRLLCLDEPFSSLDSPARESLRLRIRELLAELRIPALLVTHDRIEASSLGDFVHLVDRGRILESGPTERVFAEPGSARAASILGIENLLAAVSARGSPDGRARVRMGTSELELSRAEPLSPGLPVLIGLRAEDVEILWDASPEGSDNRVPALVRSVIPEGPWIRLVLDAGTDTAGREHPIVALLPRRSLPATGVREGARVTARLPADGIRLFQERGLRSKN